MDKIKIDFKPVDNVILPFQGKMVEVRPVLTLTEQITLIKQYCSNYFLPERTIIQSSQYDYLGAELQQMLGVIALVTNIQLVDENNNLIINEGDILTSGLWGQIKNLITNYEVFRKRQERIVSDIKEELALQKSVGAVLDNFTSSVPSLLNDLIEKLKELVRTDLTEEQISKVKELSKELPELLNNSPISGLVKEAQSEKQNESESAKPKRTRKPRKPTTK